MINVADLPVEMSELDNENRPSPFDDYLAWLNREPVSVNSPATTTTTAGTAIPIQSATINWTPATGSLRGTTVTGIQFDEASNRGSYTSTMTLNESMLPLIAQPNYFITTAGL